jgi:hypothetical protein
MGLPLPRAATLTLCYRPSVCGMWRVVGVVRLSEVGETVRNLGLETGEVVGLSGEVGPSFWSLSPYVGAHRIVMRTRLAKEFWPRGWRRIRQGGRAAWKRHEPRQMGLDFGPKKGS